MKRRLAIFATGAALYAALMAVMWFIATRNAEEKTEWQLDYGVIDVHDTVAGAIDTMLGHVARTVVRHVGQAMPLSADRMKDIATDFDIDEVNVVSRAGVILASNDPSFVGTRMAGDPVMGAFMALTNGVVATVSQPFRPNALNPGFRAKYLAAAFPGGDGFVQVGLDERRLSKMLPGILGYIFDEWLLGKTGFFLCSDRSTGRLISNPSRHRDEAKTLAGTGYDAEAARRYEIVADGKSYGTTFVQRLFGEKCYCRAFIYGGHLFVAALPEREYYDMRTLVAVVFGVLLALALCVFGWFADRVMRDSDRLKAFYADEDARRAKDMEIAKTIQASALPAEFPDSRCFGIYADMSPARDVGGDFFDCFSVDATHFAFLVADVSGKGVTAALYMMTAKTLIKDTLASVCDPAAALSKVNAELCANNTANMFLTAWVGVLDLETGTVAYANAGHNPPVKITGDEKNGGGRVGFVTDKSGPVLAFMPGVSYAPKTLVLGKGDALFLYTDGVTEATDRKNELFGEERLARALAAVRDPEPRSLCNVVRISVSAFSDGAAQADDITVLAIRYHGAPRIFSRGFAPSQEGVAGASGFLDEALSSVNGAADAVSAPLHVIVDEVCSNIVRHSGTSGFAVDIAIEDDPGEVRVTFTDDGVAYDPLLHADPDTTLPVDKRPIGGLGIMMVKKMADEVSYRRVNGRNRLLVVKKFGSPRA